VKSYFQECHSFVIISASERDKRVDLEFKAFYETELDIGVARET